jgi:hypothetical protein
MNGYLKTSIALGLSAGLLAGEVFGESALTHGEFVAVSPTPMPNVAVTNTTAAVISSRFESFRPVEVKIPQDRLVVNTAGLMLVVGGKPQAR